MERIWLKSYPEGIPSEIPDIPYKSIPEMFEGSCQKFSDKKALSNMGVSLTYKKVDKLSRNFAAYLQHSLKLRKGSRIAIMLPNVLQYYVVLFGALRAGLIVVNINPLYTARELKFQLIDSGAQSIIVLENFAHVLETVMEDHPIKNVIVTKLADLFPTPKHQIVNFVVKYVKRMIKPWEIPSAVSFDEAIEKGAKSTFTPVKINPEDVAFLQYTGGTTGIPKGAMLSHHNMLANALQAIVFSGGAMREGKEIALTPLPLYHIFSLTVSCMAIVWIGSEVVLITNPRDLPHMVKEIKKIPYTMIVGINTLYNALAHNEKFRKTNYKSLRISVSGGSATQAAVAKEWQKLTGNHILEGYGLTEASPVVCVNPFNLDHFTHSIGLPLPSTDVTIRDENNKEVALGEVGELCVKGPQVMLGYWNHEDESKKVFTDDGWLRTGDMVKMDENGYVYVVDRKKDMIIVSGFNVYPNEVEDVLASHPDILEAAVIGVPDEKSGEVVKAFIIKRNPSLTEEEIKKYCKENLTGYKRPKFIEFRNELPKSNIGKILRRELREQEENS